MNNIILLATYWNEADWIEASLEQILKIDPVEIIICDGNFDPRVENRSTDGTREIIQSFVNEHSNRAKMISAERVETNTIGWEFFNKAGAPASSKYNLGRISTALKCQFLINAYRVNQALTFAKMVNISNKWKTGRWVMSYDADQFYTDALINFFKITNSDVEFDLITADEYTFPYDFNNYTDNYELRKWNNMPHRIKKNLAVYPTRHFMIESKFAAHNYPNNCKSAHGGVYHHYKFRWNAERLASGYKLGDRKPPNDERFTGLKSSREILMPSVIKKRYQLGV